MVFYFIRFSKIIVETPFLIIKDFQGKTIRGKLEFYQSRTGGFGS